MQYSILQLRRLNNDFSNTLKIYSPIDGSLLGEIPKTNSFQIQAIIQDLNNSFNNWRITPYFVRKELILNFKNLLIANIDELSDIMVYEIAKTKKDAIVEIKRTIEYIDLTIIEYEKILKNPIVFTEKEHHIKHKVAKFIYQPLGVVLAISPFNYPINLLITKIIPALITGNTVVYKPAKQGSILGARLSELFYIAGFSNGEISCIVGESSEIGDKLLTNSLVKMINFTGSTKIGKHIIDLRRDIPIVLEMGGKDPAIVLSDANIELAAKEIVNGCFSFNGQRCTAIKRVLVNENVHDELINKINELINKLNIGSALENNDITQLISKKSIDYNLSLVNDAIKKGAIAHQPIKIVNNIMYPILLTNVNTDMRIAWEETFAPILPIIKVKDINEAIQIANKSKYGLQASIFTTNKLLAEKIALELECGTVNINKAPSRAPDIFPFLGVKDSGVGVQGVKEAILSVQRIKGVIDND